MILRGTGDFNLFAFINEQQALGIDRLIDCALFGGRDEVSVFTGQGSLCFRMAAFSNLVMELNNYRIVGVSEPCSLAHGSLLSSPR